MRWAIIQEFAHIVHSKLAGIKIENIFGTATAGIPHAALLGHLLQLPFEYVRGSKKEHGKQNQIEGVYQSGQRVIVIEDLISTGGSVIEVVKTLQQAGLEVVAVIAIFNYQLKKAITAFNELQIPLYTLTTFDALVANTDILTSDQQIMLKQFHEQLNQ
ncbi:orotate phosphoribosyltransferase [Spiroplasma endosymbiont of Glossina fuscipes fuscipes]|uniref:orotate phosphoribosyltransferase n=1 Tax=Spiroplasma endosymbiont of Glossina fuscipes fuscipes TaxID=2004463 RepID=UPI003CFB10F3